MQPLFKILRYKNALPFVLYFCTPNFQISFPYPQKHGIIPDSEVATNGETSDAFDNEGHSDSSKINQGTTQVLNTFGDGTLGMCSHSAQLFHPFDHLHLFCLDIVFIFQTINQSRSMLLVESLPMHFSA